MVDLTTDQVASLLEIMGYQIPEPDLSEIVHRLNALMEGLRGFDQLDLFDVEPWPNQLTGRVKDG